MYKRSVVLLFCLLNSVSMLFGEENGPSEALYGTPPAQILFDLRKMHEAQVQVKYSNYRLLYGASGNGVRMTAKLYAPHEDTIFKEILFAELLAGYKKFGSEYVKGVFYEARKTAESKGKLVVLHISGIDEVVAQVVPDIIPMLLGACQEQTSCGACRALNDGMVRIEEAKRQHELVVADHRIVLELMLIEIEKEENEGKVFTVLSTHHIERVHTDFLRRLECPIVGIKTDGLTLATVFFTAFFEMDVLKDQKKVLHCMQKKLDDRLSSAVRVHMNELGRLEIHSVELATQFARLKEKNDVCWFEQKEYANARTVLLASYREIGHMCEVIASSSDQALICAQVAEEKEYYAAVKTYVLLFKLVMERKRLLCEHPELVIKIVAKIVQNQTNRAAKKLAISMVRVAEVENGGELTKEIVLKFVS